MAENDYPPVPKDEVFKEIFEQAENFKKYAASGSGSIEFYGENDIITMAAED